MFNKYIVNGNHIGCDDATHIFNDQKFKNMPEEHYIIAL